MAVTQTLLANGESQTNGTGFTTASVSPSSDYLQLLAVHGSNVGGAGAPAVPSISGNGLTWVLIAEADTDTSYSSVFLYRAMGSSPSTGTLTITYAETMDDCQWSLSEFGNVDTSGTNGSGAIVQSAVNTVGVTATIIATLAAFSSTNNATYGAFGQLYAADGTAPTTTPGTGFTEISLDGFDDGSYTSALQTQWRVDNDTTVDITWDSSYDCGVVAVEIKEAVVSVTGTLNTTDADDTITADGLMQPSGTLNVTDADDTIAATGAETFSGTLNVTDADDTIIASGSETFSGTLNTTDVDDTITASGIESYIGILNTTDADDTITASGSETFSGTLNTTDVDDTITASGSETFSGNLNTTDVDDTITASGTVISLNVTGTLNVTDADDTIVADGLMQPSGTLNTTDADDIITALGTSLLAVTGTLNVTDADDTITASGTVVTISITGTLNVIDADDTIVASGTGGAVSAIGRIDITYIVDKTEITYVSNYNLDTDIIENITNITYI